MAESDPLREALPPATDYLTYLTILEYNLKPENLSTLHEVLQDTKLTTNIGWDLVHLLLPLLPASEECLQDIARLGNPREVILKVTESLRLIDFEGLQPDSEDESTLGAEAETTGHPTRTAPVESEGSGSSGVVTQAVEAPPPPPLPVSQFTSLLSMLAILHPRIKTQYPSRFLSTTLQAILASFSRSVSHRDLLVSAIVSFVKAVTGTKLRPRLPSRKSSGQLLRPALAPSAPDPENDVSASGPSEGEAAMQDRLLQSFITHVLEEFISSLSSTEDVPGVAWCSRLQEKLHPERTVPNRRSMTERFSDEEDLQDRLTVVGELLAVARDLDMRSADLMTAITTPDAVLSKSRSDAEEDEPPKTAADIPLSKPGCLYLLCAREASSILYGASAPDTMYNIFPEHHRVLSNLVSNPSVMGGDVGTEPEGLLDATLAFGLMALEANRIGEPVDDEQFNQYLQVISLISSNCPSPNLRYHAFYLTTTVLRSHPSDTARLAFIRDTLEHCPFENLKVTAVSWVKGEVIEANPPTQAHSHKDVHDETEHESLSLWSTPLALDNLAPFLFPDLTHDLSATDIMESWLVFDQNLHFYLASLNLYYLLLSAEHLHEPLAIGDLHTNNDVAGSFMHPLRLASVKFREEARDGGQLAQAWEGEDDVSAHIAQLELLDATLDRVTSAVAALNKI
ncbi:YAP1-binding protein 1 [Zalaria obscura]|uniref:YAP1-binding protein 1 n=1 Tax=Zalaria obscura TaxID=2024903 RepID=A0ACC3SNP4_9PEZI